MHILYLHQYYAPKGASGNNRSRALAKIWTEQGCKVSVFTSTAFFPLGWEKQFSAIEIQSGFWKFQEDGVTVWALHNPYSHLMGFWKRISAFLSFYFLAKRFLKRVEVPDIIYASSTPPTVGELGRVFSQRWNIPFIFETVDVWPDVPEGMGILKNKIVLRWLHFRVNKIYQAAAKIVALSPGMKAQIISHGISPDKILVAVNGTDPNEILPQTKNNQHGITLLYSGTVGKANDVTFLVEVAKNLEGIENLHFVILGDGNDWQRVKELVLKKGAKNLSLPGKVTKEEANAYLNTADIGLVCFAPFPVLEANSANKFFDYLAAGIPLILNYKGWQAEVMEKSGAGRSSPQGDIAAFCDNIMYYVNNPQARVDAGREGRKLAETEFNREKIALELLNEFRKLKST